MTPEQCAEALRLIDAEHVSQRIGWRRRVLDLLRALAAQQAPAEPVARVESWTNGSHSRNYKLTWLRDVPTGTELYTAPPAPQARKPLTPREVELIDGMIDVQLRHAKQCDGIANRTMAEKQKAWDMERVALLQKLRAHGITADRGITQEQTR